MARKSKRSKSKIRTSANLELLEDRRMMAVGDPLGNSVNVAAGGVGSNHNSLFQDFGGVTTLSNNNIVVTWRSRDNDSASPTTADGDDYGAFFQVFSSTGSATSGTIFPYSDINSSGTGKQGSSQVTALTGGGFAITWNSAGGPGDVYVDGNGRGGDTYVRVYDNSGSAVSATTKVNEATSDEETPTDIISLSGGGFAVVYKDDNENTNNKDDYFVRAFNAAGVAQGASVRLGGSSHDALFMDFGDAVALSNGGFAVGWRTRDDGATPSPDGAGYGTFFQVFNASGTSVASASTPYGDTNAAGTGDQHSPKMAALSGGGFAMTWSSEGATGDVGDGDTYTRVFSNTGASVSSTTRVNETTSDEETPTAIVSSTSGGYGIVYRDDNDNSGNKDDFFFRAYSSVGVAAASSVRLGGTGHDPLFMDFGDMVALTNGGYATAWRTRDDDPTPSPDGDDYGAFYQVFTSAGASVGSAATPYVDINSGGTGKQGQAKLTSIIGGGFAMTWNSAGGPGDVFVDGNGRGGDTYARIFDNSGTALDGTIKVNESEPTGTNDEQQPTAIVSASNGDYVIVYNDENENTDNKDDYFLRVFEGVGLNVAPTMTGAPTDITFAEDVQGNVDLSAVTVADTDNDPLTLTLTASAGTFAAPGDGSAVGAGVTETLVSGTSITLAGTAADINTYLDTASNIQYTGASNISGDDAAMLSLVVNDGSTDSTTSTINVDLTAVNDLPSFSISPTDITILEDTESDFDLSAMAVADVDGDSLELTITFTGGAGTFSVPADGSGVGAGVTETLDSPTSVTLIGLVADINSYLSTASNLRITPASNTSGNDVFSFNLSLTDVANVPATASANVDITAVNDPPTLTATGHDPLFTEYGAAVDLFSGVTVGTAEAGQLLTGLEVTVTISETAETLWSTAQRFRSATIVAERPRPTASVIALLWPAIRRPSR